MKRWAAVLMLGGLAACSDRVPTRIDGSSPAAFARTVAIARQDLPENDRLTFDGAIANVPARRYADHDPAATARVAFDGQTAAEVVATEHERANSRGRR